MSSNTKGTGGPRKTRWNARSRKVIDEGYNEKEEHKRFSLLLDSLDQEIRDEDGEAEKDRGYLVEDGEEDVVITEDGLPDEADEDDDEYVLENNEIIDEIEMTANDDNTGEEVLIEEVEKCNHHELDETVKPPVNSDVELQKPPAEPTEKTYSTVFRKNIGTFACIGGIFVAFTLYFTYNAMPFRVYFGGDKLPSKHPEL